MFNRFKDQVKDKVKSELSVKIADIQNQTGSNPPYGRLLKQYEPFFSAEVMVVEHPRNSGSSRLRSTTPALSTMWNSTVPIST